MWSICPTMDGVLVVFHLPPGSSSANHREFRRRIYGEETASWSGRYRYRRRGVLDDLPHVRLYWGVVIVRREDARKFLAVVRRNGGEAVTRRIGLTPGDRKSLGLSPR